MLGSGQSTLNIQFLMVRFSQGLQEFFPVEVYKRQVVTNPKLILADEPTGNLDSKNGAEVMNLLTELNQEGTPIIMVTHRQHDASFAHRTIHLFDGSVVASVAAQDL